MSNLMTERGRRTHRSSGELVELADLPVEQGDGYVAARLADAARGRSRRVPHLRPLVGRRAHYRAADERRLVARLDCGGELLVQELAASCVDGEGLVRAGEVRVERGLREAGLDQQDSDAVLADLVVQRFRIALERVLARCVQRHERDR